MAQVFGSDFSSNQDLRSRLVLPLVTPSTTPRASTISAEHQASSGPKVASSSGYYPSQPRPAPSNYTLSPNVQHTTLPSQAPNPLQHAMSGLSTHSPTMYFNDYLKMHNQMATPGPFGPVTGSAYGFEHGAIPGPSASGYSAPSRPHFPQRHTWSDATSSSQFTGTSSTAILAHQTPASSTARENNAVDYRSYHPATFLSGVPVGRGPRGDQQAAQGPGPQTYPNDASTLQPEDTDPSPTTSTRSHQTWEELAREFGLHL
jgi:hypothetical protein